MQTTIMVVKRYFAKVTFAKVTLNCMMMHEKGNRTINAWYHIPYQKLIGKKEMRFFCSVPDPWPLFHTASVPRAVHFKSIPNYFSLSERIQVKKLI